MRYSKLKNEKYLIDTEKEELAVIEHIAKYTGAKDLDKIQIMCRNCCYWHNPQPVSGGSWGTCSQLSVNDAESYKPPYHSKYMARLSVQEREDQTIKTKFSFGCIHFEAK